RVPRHADDIGGAGMTGRFPAPWRIVEIPRGFAVEDATGLQLCAFYGRADPNIAGHTGFLTMDEARQLAFNFARLPELSERTSARRDVAKATPQHTSQSRESAQKRHSSTPTPPRQPGTALGNS